jgi:hypothetical protein
MEPTTAATPDSDITTPVAFGHQTLVALTWSRLSDPSGAAAPGPTPAVRPLSARPLSSSRLLVRPTSTPRRLFCDIHANRQYHRLLPLQSLPPTSLPPRGTEMALPPGVGAILPTCAFALC